MTVATEVDIRGVRVPKVGYGTFLSSGDECRNGVLAALEAGYKLIDTAQMYKNEDVIGKAIADSGVDRDEIFLTTKIDNPNHAPDAVRSSFEASLRDLGVDDVDLLMIHWPVQWEIIGETLDAIVRLHDEGKAREIGVSNFSPEQQQYASSVAPIFCNQVEFHPLFAQPTLSELAVADDIVLTAYAPFAAGAIFKGEHAATLAEIGRDHGKSISQVVIRWLIQKPNVVTIPKSVTPERIAQNLDVFDFELGADEVAVIDGLDAGERFFAPPFGNNPWPR